MEFSFAFDEALTGINQDLNAGEHQDNQGGDQGKGRKNSTPSPASKKARGPVNTRKTPPRKQLIADAICFTTKLALLANARLDQTQFADMVGFVICNLPSGPSPEYPKCGKHSGEVGFAVAIGKQFVTREEVSGEAKRISNSVKKKDPRSHQSKVQDHWNYVRKTSRIDHGLRLGLPAPDHVCPCCRSDTSLKVLCFDPQKAMVAVNLSLSPPPARRGVVRHLHAEVYRFLLYHNYAHAAYAYAILGLDRVELSLLERLASEVATETLDYLRTPLDMMIEEYFPQLPASLGSPSIGTPPLNGSVPSPNASHSPHGSSSEHNPRPGMFAKRCISRYAALEEFNALIRVSNLALPQFVPTHEVSGSVIWMSYGGMTLDRIRHLPCQDLPTLFLRLIHQGLQGLQVLWTQHGMVHGDVKPFNVVMDQTDEGWRWRYIDYSGLSYTNHYLDPDLLSEGSSYYRHNKADGLSDLFALLLTVVEILLEIPPCCQALPPNGPTLPQVAAVYSQGKDRLASAFSAALNPSVTGDARQAVHNLLNHFEKFAAPRAGRLNLTFEDGNVSLFQPFF